MSTRFNINHAHRPYVFNCSTNRKIEEWFNIADQSILKLASTLYEAYKPFTVVQCIRNHIKIGSVRNFQMCPKFHVSCLKSFLLAQELGTAHWRWVIGASPKLCWNTSCGHKKISVHWPCLFPGEVKWGFEDYFIKSIYAFMLANKWAICRRSTLPTQMDQKIHNPWDVHMALMHLTKSVSFFTKRCK